MDMQDKDMDGLFSSKLDDFEVQPSAQVWSNISAELEARARKKKLAPILSMAASIIVLVAAGILFIPQKQYPVKNQIVIKSHSAPVLQTNTSKKAATVTSAVYAVANKTNANHPTKTTREVNTSKHLTIDAIKLVNTTEQPVLAQANQTRPEAIKPVVPDEDITLQPMAMPVLDAKHTLANVQLPVADKQTAKPVKKRHGMNTFGDMVNAVVAKIDKRQDKFIQFSNTDGDEATITSVNLGLVKIKKEDKVD